MLMDTPRFSVAKRSGPIAPSPGSILLGAASVLTFVFAMLLAGGDDVLIQLKGMSAKLRTIELDLWMVGAGFAGALVSTTILTFLYCARRLAFWFIAAAAFSCSELLIAPVSYVSFGLRYCVMVMLVGAALSRVLSSGLRANLVQALCLVLLGWILLRTLLGDATGTSLVLLPVYAMMLFGIVVGQQPVFRVRGETEKVAVALAWLGVVMTFVHVSAFRFSIEPYADGRFKSYYILATNFANTYVLLVVAMMWRAIVATNRLQKVFLWVLVGIGAVLLIKSGTRNSILVLGLAWSVLGLASKTPRMYFLGGAIAVALAFAGKFVSRLSQSSIPVGRLGNIDVNNRIEVWRLAWAQIEKNPLWGYGPGLSGDVLGQSVETWERSTFINAHNVYLGFWLQLGIAGVLLLVSINVTAILRGLRSRWSVDGWMGEYKATSLSLAIIIALTVAGLFEDNLSGRGSLQQFLWAVSICIVGNKATTAGDRRG